MTKNIPKTASFEDIYKAIKAIGEEPVNYYGNIAIKTANLSVLIKLNNILNLSEDELNEILLQEGFLYFGDVFYDALKVKAIEASYQIEKISTLSMLITNETYNRHTFRIPKKETDKFDKMTAIQHNTTFIGYVDIEDADMVCNALNTYMYLLSLPLNKLKGLFSDVE